MPFRRTVPILLLAMLALGGCTGQEALPPPTRLVPTLFPTLPASSAPSLAPSSAPDADAPSDTGWIAGAHSIELRRMTIVPGGDRPAFPVVIVRLEPQAVRLRVAYEPDTPRGLQTWFEERRALVAINGGFFTEENRATALLVSDGVASGASYQGFGGMLTVGPDGAVSILALRDTPYDPAMPLAQAVQSFPMLVFPGGIAAPVEEDGQRARRTVVALDQAGRVLLAVFPTSALSLRELAEWLAASDLGVERALNLDGGSSTGLHLRAGELSERVDAFVPLPIVIIVEAS
jgi:uncharacterized protein YigE (DUF2233 family)